MAKKSPNRSEQFVKHPRDLIESDAWRSMTINEHRFVERLEIDHLTHAGRENGKLRATYEQLEAFGIGRRLIARTCDSLQQKGIIDATKGGMRIATRYALTWLPLHDGSGPSNRWRTYKSPKRRRPAKTRKTQNLVHEGAPDCVHLVHEGEPENQRVGAFLGSKTRNLVHEGEPRLVHEGEPDARNLVHEGEPDPMVHEGALLSRCSIHGASISKDVSTPIVRHGGLLRVVSGES